MYPRIKQGTLLGAGTIAIFLSALYFLPQVLTKRQHTFTPPTESGAALFSVDTPLHRVSKPDALVPDKPMVSLQDLSGNKDQLYIINFWATWCPPCIEEMPSLEYLHRQLGALVGRSAPKLITISVDEGRDEITRLFKTLSFTPTFPVLHDPNGTFATSLGSTKFPETYLVDGSGKILHKWIGPQNWLSNAVLGELKKYYSSKA